MTDSTQKKPWYKSKIILLAGTLLLVFGSNLLFGGLSRSGVTPEQIEAIQTASPQVEEVVTRLQNGENITNMIGLIVSALIVVARGWFTKGTISK